MRLLKKASYKDIIEEENNVRINKKSLLVHYKEYELYLSQADLEILYKDINNPENTSELTKLTDGLRKSKSVITAIHCPESLFKTINDKEKSTNYLSFCEILDHDKSRDCFMNCIELANYINQEQYSEKQKDKSIILVIHEGCKNGCTSDKDINCERQEDDLGKLNNLINKINKLNIKSKICVAIENIPPFYCEDNRLFPLGENCGWESKNQIINKKLTIKEGESNEETTYIAYLNKKLEEKNVQFGLCVDFCHIIATYKLKEYTSESIEEYIKKYFEKIKDNPIYLYHVSNLGMKRQHGAAFIDGEDDKLVDTIRECCYTYGRNIPITFEMEGGQDKEKACRNFNLAVHAFSKKHTSGRFGELLSADNTEDSNNTSDNTKELRCFFDNLFYIYTCDFDDFYNLSRKVMEVKKFVLSNTKQLDNETLFGFTKDGQKENTALLRLKSYIYYARFCNLGHYLAENHYKKDDNIFANEDIKDDFALAMMYFMFNDKWKQCTYTGVSYRFLIDFLPRNDNFYRFNDGIEETLNMTKKKISCIEVTNKERIDVFKEVVKNIRMHINGNNSNCLFYSVGKNFGNCLFKYYDPNQKEWSLMIYEKVPVNYIEVKEGERERKYSIQAYLQKEENGKNIENISLDISSFANGRNGNNTDSLQGFIHKVAGDNITLEKVASISDGEIIYTSLPKDKCQKYNLSKEEGVILKKMYLEWNESKDKNTENIDLYKCEYSNDIDTCMNTLLKDTQNKLIILDEYKKKYSVEEENEASITDEEIVEKFKENIEKYNDTGKIDKLREIMKKVQENNKNSDGRREKESVDGLRKLEPYKGQSADESFEHGQKIFFEKYEKMININAE